MYSLKNGEYYNHMMCLDQSHVRKALIVVYSNDYLTLIQHLKKKWKKFLCDSKTQIVKFAVFASNYRFFVLTRPKQSQLKALTFYLFIYLFIYMVVYVTDHRCFSSQGDWRLAYPWLWWSSFELLSNFVVIIYYITIWK